MSGGLLLLAGPLGAVYAYAAGPIPVGAIVVGTSATACSGTTPDFPTISDAVAAATAGSTIYVCPGVYPESVTIDKQLTLLGAQYGVDASDPLQRTNPAAESIIDAPVDSGGNATAPIVYGATGGTIDGFTLEGANGASGQVSPGILALNGAGGGAFTWQDNIITDNGEGIQFNTGGDSTNPASSINHNRLVTNNNDTADGRSGGGIFVTNGTANNVTIASNYFDDNDGNGDINTTGPGTCSSDSDPSLLSQGLVITNNTSVHDDGFENNFAVLFCSQGAQVSTNTVTYTDHADPSADSAIYIGGGDYDLTVSDNTLTGGHAAGVNVNSQFYPAGTGVTVSNNTITDHSDGVIVQGGTTNYDGFTVSNNTISGSTVDGILVEMGSNGTISGNVVSGSAVYDCQDQTTGSGTAATADTWTSDSGATSSPAGLCSAIPPAETPEAPTAILLPASVLGLIAVGAGLRKRHRS